MSRRPTRLSGKPSLRVERTLQREGFRLVAGMDEVGRGALAGPVSVGVVVVDETCRSGPVGLRDSKLLPPHRREQLVAPVRRWALAWGVGHASAAEIDEVGIMVALRRAGRRALLATGVRPDIVLLDGNHDWLTDPAREGLLAFADAPADTAAEADLGDSPGSQDSTVDLPLPVRTLIKGDMRCSSVAGASVLAKVERDAAMVAYSQAHPDYGWAVNKGYAAPEHRNALLRLGPCALHRRSWNLLAAPTESAAAPPGSSGPPGSTGSQSGESGSPPRGLQPGAAAGVEAGAEAEVEWAMMSDVEVIRG